LLAYGYGMGYAGILPSPIPSLHEVGEFIFTVGFMVVGVMLLLISGVLFTLSIADDYEE
jgi:hypothetical protein